MLCNFRGAGKQLYRLKGIEKGGVIFDIIIQDTSLPDNFLSDGIEPIAANAKESLSMSKSAIGSFLTH